MSRRVEVRVAVDMDEGDHDLLRFFAGLQGKTTPEFIAQITAPLVETAMADAVRFLRAERDKQKARA